MNILSDTWTISQGSSILLCPGIVPMPHIYISTVEDTHGCIHRSHGSQPNDDPEHIRCQSSKSGE